MSTQGANVVVRNAESGELLVLPIGSGNLNLNQFKQLLSSVSGLAVADQIILVGPPFKSIDTQFGPDLMNNRNSVFIYLYNRRVFYDSNIPFIPITILPSTISTVDILDDPPEPVLLLRQHSSPLLRTLPDYERHFLMQRARSVAMADFAAETMKSCRMQIDRSRVQGEALSAAVGNLRDHFFSISAAYGSAVEKLRVQHRRHSDLLAGFDESLGRLASIPLHPSIRSTLLEKFPTMEPSSSSSSMSSVRVNSDAANPNISMAENKFLTLLNCIPVEKEKMWAEKCASVHEAVGRSLEELKILFQTANDGFNALQLSLLVNPASVTSINQVDVENISSLGIAKSGDVNAFTELYFDEGISSIIALVEIIDRLAEIQRSDSSHSSRCYAAVCRAISRTINLNSRYTVPSDSTSGTCDEDTKVDEFDFERLTDPIRVLGPHESNDIVSSSSSSSSDIGSTSGSVANLIEALESQRKHQELFVLARMTERSQEIAAVKEQIVQKRVAQGSFVRHQLRKIADIQTHLHKLKKRLETMSKLYKGHNEYFSHLSNLSSLPSAYETLLAEIVRRRAFTKVFGNHLSRAVEEVSRLRAVEIAHREDFLRREGGGKILPPMFFTLIPSLREKPPYFNASLTDSQWLPEVTADELDAFRNGGAYDSPVDKPERNEDSKNLTPQEKLKGSVGKGSSGGSIIFLAEPPSTNDSKTDYEEALGQFPPVETVMERLDKLELENVSLREEVRRLRGGSNRDRRTMTSSSSPSPSTEVDGKDVDRSVTEVDETSYVQTQEAVIEVESKDKQMQSSDGKSNANNELSPEISLNTAICLEVEETVAPPDSVFNDDRRRDNVSGEDANFNDKDRRLSSKLFKLLGRYRDDVQSAKELMLIASSEESQPTTVTTTSAEESNFSEDTPTEAIVDEASDYLSSLVDCNRRLLDRINCLEAQDRERIRKLNEGDDRSTSHEKLLKIKQDESQVIAETDSISVASGQGLAISPIHADTDQIDSTASSEIPVALTPKISFCSFEIGDLALFIPASPKKDIYIPFNLGCPHRYLSLSCLQSFRQSRQRGIDAYILGKVVFIESFTASLESNPYNIPIGTEYYVFDVSLEPLESFRRQA